MRNQLDGLRPGEAAGLIILVLAVLILIGAGVAIYFIIRGVT